MGSFPVVYHLGRLILTAYGVGLAGQAPRAGVRTAGCDGLRINRS